MRIITGWVTSLLFLALGVAVPTTEASLVPDKEASLIPDKEDSNILISKSLFPQSRVLRESLPEILYSHGNIDWLPKLATAAGWPKETHQKLGEIILRESGGCPNRKGGDIVNKNCYITGVSEWNHRSDTGLLQINGVNYNPERNKWAIACRKMNICTQEPLLDPLTNLEVGYLIYQDSGWAPWDPCTWDKKRCPTKTKP